MVTITLYAKQKKRHRCIEQTFGLWEKARVGCFKRTTSKHVYYLWRKRSPAKVGCMRQVLGPGALGRPRGIRWRGRWEGGSGYRIHVNPWLIHVNVWHKPLQYCKVISLQLIKINEKTNKTKQKDDAIKVLHSVCQLTWKTQQWSQDWKRSIFIPVQRRAMPDNVQTTTQLCSFHMLPR